MAALGVFALALCGCDPEREPAQLPAPPPSLAISPSSVSLSGTVGQAGLDALVHIEGLNVLPDLTWSAVSDVDWLVLVPQSDVFDSSSGNLSLKVTMDGLGPGTHVAVVSLSLEGVDGVLAYVPVTVELQSPEDPEVVAARTFWESGNYRSYWDLKAPGDVRATLLSYTFPEYGLGAVEEVHVKAIDFGYVPELYARPVARARCEVSFIVWEELTGAAWEQDVRRFTRHWGEVDVILQVDPGPYSTSHNSWSVVDLQDRSITSSSASVGKSDSTGGDDSDCGCGE